MNQKFIIDSEVITLSDIQATCQDSKTGKVKLGIIPKDSVGKVMKFRLGQDGINHIYKILVGDLIFYTTDLYIENHGEKEIVHNRFIVDVPSYDIDSPWIEIETFETRKEAVDFCKKHYGADDNGNINLISEMEEDE